MLNRLAEDWDTPAEAAGQFADDWATRLAVAHNPNTPIAVLEQLAGDTSLKSCTGVVGANPAAPAHLLAELARSDCYHERVAVADHPHTPANVVAQLTQDPRPEVQWAAHHNPNNPIPEPPRPRLDDTSFGQCQAAPPVD